MLQNKIAIGLTALTLLMALILGACGQTTPTPTAQAAALTISTASLDSGQIGIIYSRTLKATGGSGKYTWSISQGTLPGGLHLDEKSGIISGAPNAPGTANFTVQVSDGANTSSKALALTINSISVPLAVGTSSLAMGEVGVNYSRSLTASGGSGTYTWAITNGALPDGLTLEQKGGVISGTPKASGTFTFSIQVKDDTGATRDQPLRITIVPTPTITTDSLGDAEVGIQWGKQLGATGGNGNYAWSLAGGALPDGINLDSENAAIWGTPTKAGDFNFTIKLSDGVGSSTKDFKMTVVPTLKPLVIGTTSLPNGQNGTSYSQTLKASGGGKTYIWQVTAGALPDGLTLDSKAGTITGTPKTAGVFYFTIQASDEYGANANQNLSITVS